MEVLTEQLVVSRFPSQRAFFLESLVVVYELEAQHPLELRQQLLKPFFVVTHLLALKLQSKTQAGNLTLQETSVTVDIEEG